MGTAARRDRYSAVAIALHWGIAALVVLQIVIGWRLDGAERFVRSGLLPFHKSIGISILVLTAVRLVWRVWRQPPLRNDPLKPIEQMLAKWVHVCFYVVLLVLPLSGWAIASMRSSSIIQLFGFVPWPRFPLVSLLSDDRQEALSVSLGDAHAAMTWLLICLVSLHVAGALKHHFISRDGTVGRMLPGLSFAAVGWSLAAIPIVATVLGTVVYFGGPSEPAPRPKPTDWREANLFRDVIEPALDRRCGSCHSEDNERGGLSVTSYESLMRGGRSGSAVVARRPLASELFRRISLSPEDPKFMPRNGRRPLSPSQVSAVRLWIEMGASATGSVGALQLSEEQGDMLRRLLDGAAAPDALGPPSEPLPVVPEADAEAVKRLFQEGFVVRKVSSGSELLVIDFTGRGRMSEAAWGALARIAVQTRSLNLRNAGLTDEDLSRLGDFKNLTQLRLESNAIGDAGMAHLTTVRGLVSLNLVNTKVGDAGLKKLTELPMLRRLYIWRSLVSPTGIAALRRDRPGLQLTTGVEPQLVEVKTPSRDAPD
jgi:cytochrome b561